MPIAASDSDSRPATGGIRRWVLPIAALCALLALVGAGLVIRAKVALNREPVVIWTNGKATVPRISETERQRLIELATRTIEGSNGAPLCIDLGTGDARKQELAVEVRFPEPTYFITPKRHGTTAGQSAIVVLRGELMTNDGRSLVLLWGDPNRGGGALISPTGIAELTTAAEAALAE